MNVVQEIRRINETESRLGTTASWHDEYKDSAYIFIGGLPFGLTEGDVICVFSQFGEVININLVRDKDTGKFKGYGFLQYEDQRSTVLAVDNLNGAKVLDRVLRVDHVKNYRQPGAGKDEEAPAERIMNAAPEKLALEEREENEEDEEEMMRAAGIDPEDPMAAYYLAKYKRKVKREKRGKSDKKHKKRRRSEDRGGGGGGSDGSDGGKRHHRASADKD